VVLMRADVITLGFSAVFLSLEMSGSPNAHRTVTRPAWPGLASSRGRTGLYAPVDAFDIGELDMARIGGPTWPSGGPYFLFIGYAHRSTFTAAVDQGVEVLGRTKPITVSAQTPMIAAGSMAKDLPVRSWPPEVARISIRRRWSVPEPDKICRVKGRRYNCPNRE